MKKSHSIDTSLCYFSNALHGLQWLFLIAFVLMSTVPQAGARESSNGSPDPAISALQDLRRESGAAVKIRAFDGFVTTVSMSVPVADPGGDPIDNALHFLGQYRDLYGLKDPENDLYPHRVVSGDEGDHVFFRRRYGNLPAFNGTFGVHMHGDSVVATNGHLPPALPGFGGPRIDAERAESFALAGD